MSTTQIRLAESQSITDQSGHPGRVSPRLVMRYERDPSPRAFSESLQLILKAMLRDQAGDAVCLYEYIDPGTLVLRETIGMTVGRLESANLQLSEKASEWLRNLHTCESVGDAQRDFRVSDFPETLLHQFSTIVIAPIRDEGRLRGLITLGWRKTSSAADKSSIERLKSLIDCAASLLLREPHQSATSRLLAEISEVETELANLKIAQRAADFVNNSQWTERAPFTLQEHVSRVLEGVDINQNLREHLAILQSRLHDRRLLATAKARVQHALGVNEEGAYLFLRNTSRRTRRPLRDIAQDVLNSDALLKKVANDERRTADPLSS